MPCVSSQKTSGTSQARALPKPERIVLDVDSPSPALLVVAEAWFPGWGANINGQPAECFPANAWMRAVLVPAGRSQVVLAYRSNYFALGATVSLATLILLLALFKKQRSLHRRPDGELGGNLDLPPTLP